MNDCRFLSWRDAAAAAAQEPGYLHEAAVSAEERLDGCSVVSATGDLERVDALLAAGAQEVLLGEGALRDSTLVREAVTRHGERIGLWLPVRRAEASWGLDTVSNADFSTLAITNPVPRWMICQADGTLTDVDACWWAGEMIKAGCGKVLVSVATPEDDDLLACAEMAECAGERFWLDAGSADIEELRFWVRYGQARRLVLPAGSDTVSIHTALAQRLDDSEGFPDA
ncbi:MAG: hypothetical protein OQK94_02705 [Gammaproteobacteria bacterium]|nr:hypothetical protein [Gammaproteobacteria bacterium]MCW8840598.1 hypothetical protein [Gammaproteobacteria bacterium]MCW8928403.1 hypothetical protein [Gammaproteobacteria bacterium]MCW8957700.1 hypothetical protein [Gammaproteobacteria bacterium]MCW8972431.1 hypothetical protein [Gammaproteobacteria bacterium]